MWVMHKRNLNKMNRISDEILRSPNEYFYVFMFFYSSKLSYQNNLLFASINNMLLQLQAVAVVKTHSGDSVVRKRRDWIIPPKNLTENKDYTREKYIARVGHWSLIHINIIHEGRDIYIFIHLHVWCEKLKRPDRDVSWSIFIYI